jgi:hypothetical protein
MSWTFACVLLSGSVAFTFWLERLEAGESVVSWKMLDDGLEVHGWGGSSSVNPADGLVAMPGLSRLGWWAASELELEVRMGSDRECWRWWRG